jgi:hypothetical protein
MNLVSYESEFLCNRAAYSGGVLGSEPFADRARVAHATIEEVFLVFVGVPAGSR